MKGRREEGKGEGKGEGGEGNCERGEKVLKVWEGIRGEEKEKLTDKGHKEMARNLGRGQGRGSGRKGIML